MPPESAQHLKKEALVGGVSNALFNGVIAWLLLRGGSPLAWGGEHSFVVDIVATAFILPFIVALIVIPLQRGKVKKGKLTPVQLDSDSRLAGLAGRIPRPLLGGATAFGLLGALVIAPATLLLFYLVGVQQVTPANYAVFKGVWAGLMAALLVLPMVAYAHRPQALQAIGRPQT
ncbi:MAG: hypothetical protein R3228_12165 [Halioglobus sp.]|nr:hypothetical protein [Halioglobus sp.]